MIEYLLGLILLSTYYIWELAIRFLVGLKKFGSSINSMRF